MPTTISDKKLSDLYKNLEKANGTIDDAKALEMLATVADSSGYDSTRALAKLKGFSRESQIDFIKKGMSNGEKKDLVAILDGGKVQMDPSARQFFEAVLGRVAPPPPPPPPVDPQPIGGPITLTGSQKDGFNGVAKPGDQIEAINISAAPTGRLHMEDTTVIATAGADGKFSGKLTGDQAPKEGDLIRMRTRHTDGTTSDWVVVKAGGIAPKDTRNAEVAVFRIGVSDAGSGKVNLANINESRQVSEPGAKLQFTNLRTNEKTVVTINETGNFPKDFKLNGKPGDSFNIAATDGVNNVDYGISVGKVTVPGGDGGVTDLIKDPALHKDEMVDGKPGFEKKRFTGPLFKDGVDVKDAQQGQIGDCYFPSAISAIAVQHPEVLEKMIKDNGDGTYTITFKERDRTGKFRDVPIKVDADLYVRSWGGPLYGSSNGDKSEKGMEMWFPLVEKAYAQWKGSYNEIGNGGMSSDVMQDVLGRDGQDMPINESNADRVFAQLKKAFDAGQPISAGTYGEDQEARYTNTGVYADHSYSVLGYEEKDGKKFVNLRNPWGESEPAGNGANDGIFKLELKDFAKLYQTLMYTNP